MGVEASVEQQVPAPVTLHVYDLGTGTEMQAINSVLGKLGTGAFHCGVEVYGREWSFQYMPKGTGVFECKPTRCPGHTYRESVPMGVTPLSELQVRELIGFVRREWTGKKYDMLTKNCCHCSDDLCMRLGVGPIPWWTTNLAGAGATVRQMYDGVTGVLNPTLLMGCISRSGSKEGIAQPA